MEISVVNNHFYGIEITKYAIDITQASRDCGGDWRRTMIHEVTMKDLARKLGLSVSTIGRSLDDRAEISEETKIRVRQAAESLGYIRNSGARMMRTRQSSIIGLIVPNITNDFYAAAAMAMSKCFEDAGYQLVLAVTWDNPQSELNHVKALLEARAAGVVIAMTANPMKETVTLLERLLAVDFIRESGAAGRPWFGIDGCQGIALATRHLLGLGHRDIAYVGGHGDLSTGRDRVAGFRAAFREAGIDCPEDLIRTGRPDTEFGNQAMLDILSSRKPTAVVAAGAELTVGIVDAIGRCGLAVPDSISVVGFGDAPWFRWWNNGLTTMALPTYDIAYACGGYLLRRIEAQKTDRQAVEAVPFRALHGLGLIERATTRALSQMRHAP
jgi:DNA-binding LacI/PurR family transcriptional regulator